MKHWRSHLVILVMVALSVAVIPYAWGKMKREAGYRATLRSYSAAFKPGLSRKQVEDYFQANGVSSGQVCCFSEHSAYAEVVTIGQEKVFFPLCSSEQVIVVFEFAAVEPHDRLKAYPSDELKRLFLWRPMDCV